MSISPDGRYLAFVAYSAGQRLFWVRSLSAIDGSSFARYRRRLLGLLVAGQSRLAFFADGKLKRIEASGKSLQTVCSLPQPGDATGTWGSKGTLLFSQEEDGSIYRVPATGGTPSLLLESKSRECTALDTFFP